MLTGLLQFVPLLNRLVPVLAALAYIHFGLVRLDYLRQVSQLTRVRLHLGRGMQLLPASGTCIHNAPHSA